MQRNQGEVRWIRQIDVLRAVGCLMVIALHVLWMTADAAVAPAGRGWWYAWSQLLVLGGPLFFFASAVLCFLKYPEGKSLRPFLKKRLLYLGVPYVVWSAVYLLIEFASLRGSNPAQATRVLGASLLFGVRHLQFVHALIQFYLLFPMFRWLWNRADRWALVLSSFLIGIAWNDGAPRFIPLDLVRMGYSPHAGVVLAWLPYIGLGAWASRHLDRLDDLVPQPRWMYTVSAFLLSASAILVFGRSLPHDTLAGVYAGAARPAVLIAGALWLPFMLRFAWLASSGPLASLMREIGRFSPAIYFVHPLALVCVAWAAAGQRSPWPALVIIVAAAVFGTGLIVNQLMRSPAGILIAGMGRRCERLRPLSTRRTIYEAPEAPGEADFLDLQEPRARYGG